MRGRLTALALLAALPAAGILPVRAAEAAVDCLEVATRRVLPRARIDPEYANPLYTPAMAALWRGE